MIDVTGDVVTALKTIKGTSVEYQQPKKTAKYPVITYYEAGNVPDTSADDAEYTSLIAIMVDVWAATAGKMADIALEVDRVMTSIGFVRRMAYELPDPSGKYRKTMRYEIVCA